MIKSIFMPTNNSLLPAARRWRWRAPRWYQEGYQAALLKAPPGLEVVESEKRVFSFILGGGDRNYLRCTPVTNHYLRPGLSSLLAPPPGEVRSFNAPDSSLLQFSFRPTSLSVCLFVSRIG